MASVIIDDINLTNIANAIREKNGSSETYKPSEMSAAIGGIETGGGGGGGDITSWVCTQNATTGSYTHPFSNNVFNQFIDGKRFTIDTAGLSFLFASSDKLVDLSKTTINYNGRNNPYRMFITCRKLQHLPTINILDTAQKTSPSFDAIFQYCEMLRNIDEEKVWYPIWSLKDGLGSTAANYVLHAMFNGCYSLRQLPDMTVYDSIVSKQTSTSSQLYYNLFVKCYVLDTIEYLPVINTTVNITSNMFNNTFNNCSRLKDIIFATDNGIPYTRPWSSQTIDLSTYVGYGSDKYYIVDGLNYNSGIAADKQVTDDATYAALKDDPDWFSLDVAYSRYNHDSAVRTINSLPDVSSGSNNTIKFKGESGSKTDEGAINTLTEEEIAVATAKGWTVSLI